MADVTDRPARGLSDRNNVQSLSVSHGGINGRLRRRGLRQSSEDVILIESPAHASSVHASRRRRRTPNTRADTNITADDSIVDLTCTSPDDQVEVVDFVDLTSPDELSNNQRQNSPELLEVTDETVHDTAESGGSTRTMHCPVCLDSFANISRSGRQLKSTICGHVFCNVCIQHALELSKKCPTCRRKLNSRNIHSLYLPI